MHKALRSPVFSTQAVGWNASAIATSSPVSQVFLSPAPSTEVRVASDGDSSTASNAPGDIDDGHSYQRLATATSDIRLTTVTSASLASTITPPGLATLPSADLPDDGDSVASRGMSDHPAQTSNEVAAGASGTMQTATAPAYTPGQSSSEGVFANSTSSILSLTFPNLSASATSNTSPSVSLEPSSECIPPNTDEQRTTIHVVYTATTTFFGDPSNYVAPYPELSTPNFCPYPVEPEFGSGVESGAPGGLSVRPTTTLKSKSTGPQETVTFVTTDKNPSVVYSPISTPNYGKEPYDGKDGVHHTKHTYSRPNGGTKLPQSVRNTQDTPLPQKTTHKVTIEPTRVIIDRETITVRPTQTTRVKIRDNTFTINPTQVVGDGVTIHRPWNGQGNHGPVIPSSTMVGQTPVVIAPSGRRDIVVISGSTVTVPPQGTTAIINDDTVLLEPTAISLSSCVITIRNEAPQPTEVVVEGGRMITAVGPSLVIIDGTTFQYDTETPAITRTLGGQLITLGPSGVIVDAKTIGGPKAAPGDVGFAIVGGVTITQIGESILVIAGATFTVGPGGDGPLTTFIGGERISIGPEGVAFSTLSLDYPFGPTLVTTIMAGPGPTATAPALPAETDDGDDDGHDSGSHGLQSSPLHIMIICVAMGVWNMVATY